ncbi:MAG: hypothetical protein ACE5H8_11710 [Alphaproteobacteria bacterium]
MRRKTGPRLSARHSVLIWVAGAIVGWVVAFVGVYYAIRSGDNVFAEFFSMSSTHKEETAGSAGDRGLSDEDLKALQEIAPAAGATGPFAPSKPAGAPTE